MRGRWSIYPIYHSLLKNLTHLIPEEEVALAELEVVDVLLLGEGHPHGVQAGKDPAPPRAALVRHRLHLVDLKFH